MLASMGGGVHILHLLDHRQERVQVHVHQFRHRYECAVVLQVIWVHAVVGDLWVCALEQLDLRGDNP